MMKIGINGFGRIGRAVLRAGLARGLDIAVINDLADVGTLAHLLQHDSTHGTYDRPVAAAPGALVVDGTRIPVTGHHDPSGIDWYSYGADLVIEATGRFRTRADAELHLKNGARKVLVTAPGRGMDVTLVPGVNDQAYDPGLHQIISMASCTTNCVAPMVKVLHDTFGLVKGFMTTVHAYTADQRLLDAPHKDPRRARSAAVNIVPTTTGAARMVGEVIPELAGRLDGIALRVPVPDGSLTDLAAVLATPATPEEINDAFATAATGPLAGILRYSTAPLVSTDIIGDPSSCVFDAPLTQSEGTLVKIFGWYDNEWAYATRLAETATRIAAEH